MVAKTFLIPFAVGGDRTPPIPDAQQSDGSVSYTTGYGADYEKQLGVDPAAKNIERTGYNSVLNEITVALQELQSGLGLPTFSTTFAARLPGGGYPRAAVVPRADGAGYWINQLAGVNNTDPTVSASGWYPLSVSGAKTVPVSSTATVTLSTSDAAFKLLIVTGTLAVDVAIELPVWTGYSWVIDNRCTGAFQVTIKTAGGTGVVIANGAASQVSCDGTNIVRAIPPTPVTDGRILNIRMLTTTQTYVPTPGTKNVYGILISAGAAGGGAQSTATGNTAAGLGGSAGGRLDFYLPVSTIANLTLTIGAAGIGVPNAAGGAGGATTLGTMSVPGGTPGGVGVNSAPPWLLGESGNSPTPSGGNISNVPGTSGGMAFSLVSTTVVSGRGGGSLLGTGGNSRGNIRGNGLNGTGFGAGGGGAVEASAGPGGLAGGNGTGGAALLWEMS